MKHVKLLIHPQFQIGEVDPRIFGGFLEHLGRAIYEGIFDPDNLLADIDGCRSDVINALRDLKLSIVRYPGGNFVSGYHWMDGVGLQEKRPENLELAWKSIEPNRFGTDEFISLCRKMNWDPMLTVNLGTGTPEEARNWVEYCNGTVGKYAEMRRKNGYSEPHHVPLWCLGNEMDAPWQLGHMPAEMYAVKAEQAARMMKTVDPTIELVIAGSCLPSMKTYMDWDRKVLEYSGDIVDYIGFHRYVENEDETVPNFLAVTNSIDRQIQDMDAVCRFSQAKLKSSHRVYLCFDEWNIWYRNHEIHGAWGQAPHLLEEVYNFEDALVAAGFLLSFIRHADVLKIANVAQLVNVLAPILTKADSICLQTIFWPFAMISPLARGVSLQVIYDGPKYKSRKYGDTLVVDHAVVMNNKTLSIFLINKDDVDICEVSISLQEFNVSSIIMSKILTGVNAKAENTFDNPNTIVPKDFYNYQLNSSGNLIVLCPPISLICLSVE
ncbi:MAG: alpha-N-arabinofuranosidase [Bacteroidetes bacterium]|nr:alpha-N-arabinofuranosidase [Bacteroidota bacterium]